jgi:hypothetical protein
METVLILSVLVFGALMAWAAVAVRKNEQWIMKLRDERILQAEEPLADGEQAGSLCHAELRRIVGAMVVETCVARELVRKARVTLSIDDYADMMTEAERKLHMVIGCLGGLLDRCDPQISQIKGMISESVQSAPSADEGRAA